MDLNQILTFFKDLILDEQFAKLFISTLIVFFAGLVSWLVYYKQLAQRDLFEIPKLRIKNPKLAHFFDRVLYFLKYLIIFPLYSFIWFLFFSLLLALLSPSRQIDSILFLGIVIVASTRIAAYVSKRLSEDMAKLLPLTLIAIYLMNPESLSIETVRLSLANLIDYIPKVAKYLVFIVMVEWILRIWHWIMKSTNNKQKNIPPNTQNPNYAFYK